MRKYNFSAGPAMLPESIMEKAKEEFWNYDSLGVGVAELSHRSMPFAEIRQRTEKNIRDLMGISDDYAVCFMQGGASLNFSMLPLNLLKAGSFAEYADSGGWAYKALSEAEKFCDIRVIGSSQATGYDRIPIVRHWKPDPSSSYLHITTNSTIYGIQYHSFPVMFDGVPLVTDMSSDIMSRVIDVNRFGLIYASAQKNLGISGVTLLIIKKDLAERSTEKKLPLLLDYNTYIEFNSLYNTPPTFGIYMMMLVTDWLRENGGVEVIEEINTTKSEALYENIDADGFYRSPVVPSDRSRMNVVFNLPTPALEEKFIGEAETLGLVGLRGHSTVGGIRASIFNAMPLEGVEKLIDFMNNFEKRNG